ncbi:MAG: rhodanese-like domain-containing protein [Burkholderiaceae bacterium]
MQFFLDNIFLILAAFISGGLLVWPLATRGTSARQVNTLGATQLLNAEDAILVDIREASELSKGQVPQATHMPGSTLPSQMESLVKLAQGGKKPRPVILMCASGFRSGQAGRKVRKAGVAEVYSLEGGFDAWKQAGLPVSQKRADK